MADAWQNSAKATEILQASKERQETQLKLAVADRTKPEVEIWRQPKHELFDPGFLFTPSDTFSLGCTVLPQYKTSQTTDRQRDRRHIVPKARPIVRSAKNWPRAPQNRF